MRTIILSIALLMMSSVQGFADGHLQKIDVHGTPPKVCDQLRAAGADKETIAGGGCCAAHGGNCGCTTGGGAVCCDGTAIPQCPCNHDGQADPTTGKPAG